MVAVWKLSAANAQRMWSSYLRKALLFVTILIYYELQ